MLRDVPELAGEGQDHARGARAGEVASCPGLHCPGCSGGQSLGIIGGVVAGLVLLAAAVPWVAGRIWWIGGTAAVCFALAVAAGMWLERWADRRGARFAAAHGIVSRADVVLPPPARAVIVEPGPERAALRAPQVVFNIFGPLDIAQAAIIRGALARQTEETDRDRIITG